VGVSGLREVARSSVTIVLPALNMLAASELSTLLLGLLPLSHLRQRRLEVAPVAFRAHPAFRTRNTL
jgi:hypothetical protein